jgi:AcrR family transcriptional regulator
MCQDSVSMAVHRSKDEPRRYALKARARRAEETRRRITEATVELHGTVGAAKTTISAIAERAGVERLTVYRHFPDEGALFDACSAHWIAANPLPDPRAWAAIEDPERRLRAALEELYGYYRRVEPMMANNLRDAPEVPALGERMWRYHRYLSTAAGLLTRGWGARGAARQRLGAAIGHALAFPTWSSLAGEQGLSDARAADLMVRLARASL